VRCSRAAGSRDLHQRNPGHDLQLPVRREEMRELHAEGLATHGDPESCAESREGRGEALTGARAGRAILLSREM
jgi:hypothetical protein